jgi:hypothetical protein
VSSFASSNKKQNYFLKIGIFAGAHLIIGAHLIKIKTKKSEKYHFNNSFNYEKH